MAKKYITLENLSTFKDNLENTYTTLTTPQTITGTKTIQDTNLTLSNTSASGNASWQLEEDQYGQLSLSRTYNATKSKMVEFNGNSIKPVGNNGNLGSSTQKWSTIYTDKVDFNDNASITKDSSNRLNLNYSNDAKVKVGSAETTFKNRIGADSDNSQDIGRSAVRWKDLYLAGNLTDGTNSISVANIISGLSGNPVQDLTSNTAGTLDATAWGTLKSTHTATIASPTMTGLNSSYEFVNIKLSINSNNEYVKLAKNTTNKYSGLFFIEESTNLYEITAYYNGTNIILRCATVK